jgi:hypothetical protein
MQWVSEAFQRKTTTTTTMKTMMMTIAQVSYLHWHQTLETASAVWLERPSQV